MSINKEAVLALNGLADLNHIAYMVTGTLCFDIACMCDILPEGIWIAQDELTLDTLYRYIDEGIFKRINHRTQPS